MNEGDVFHYVAKPWEPAELETIVQQALVAALQTGNEKLEQRVSERTAERLTANIKVKLELDSPSPLPLFITKPVGSGTGLGLGLAYQIITQKHGGGISVESPPNGVPALRSNRRERDIHETAENASRKAAKAQRFQALRGLMNLPWRH